MQQASKQALSAQHIPLNIEALAATYAFGVPHTKYRTKNERAMAFFGILWMVYLLVFATIIFFFFISFSNITWLVWSAWLFYLSILFFCIRLFIVTLLAPKIEVFLCTEGLIYSQKSRLEIIRWDQVTTLWEDISISHDSESSDTYSYRLQRSDGMQFEFSDNIVNVQALGEKIKQKVNQQLLPQAIRAYRAGPSITFGDISVNQQGISVEGGRKTLHWSGIEGINSDGERMDIYRKGEQHRWYQQRILQIPNAGVLQGLADYIMQEFVHQELSHVMVTYKTGSTLTFGRIRLSLQGIDIDNGKKILPWSDIRGINVDTKERKVSISVRSKLFNLQALPTWLIPDSLVLKGLADRILQERMYAAEARVQHQLPQLIAAYDAGTLLTFGRISLSQQGVAVDGGKKFLSMSEISRLHLETYFGGDQLTVSKKGSIFTWQILPASELGDVDLLQGLIEHIMEELSIP